MVELHLAVMDSCGRLPHAASRMGVSATAHDPCFERWLVLCLVKWECNHGAAVAIINTRNSIPNANVVAMYEDAWYSFVPEVRSTREESSAQMGGHRRKNTLLQQPNVSILPGCR